MATPISKSCAILLIVSSIFFQIALIQAYEPYFPTSFRKPSWAKSLPTYRPEEPKQPSWARSLPTYRPEEPKQPSWAKSLPTYRPEEPKHEVDSDETKPQGFDVFDELKDKTNDLGDLGEEISQNVGALFGVQKTLNVIDACWRKNPNWARDRQQLADCAKGFGSGALGGKGGAIYVVTDDSDDPVNPRQGSLRYGLIQDGPLWITFQRDMKIKLGNELLVSSYKTIDGRGANVVIGNGGPCVTLDHVTHVIIHGVTIMDCKPGYPGMVRSSPRVLGHRGSATAGASDGDAISVLSSSKVWIDHCYLSKATDGLIDVTLASNAVTISNNFFTQHDKVILLGHDDAYTADKIMEVTVAFNHFGPGCVERMPRVRYGYAHVANNRYNKWEMYAIGGSADPTILSEGNYFMAGDSYFTKQVTKRDATYGPGPWQSWKWRSSRDVFLNGAYFVQSGGAGNISPAYTAYQAFPVAGGAAAPSLTADAGPLHCIAGRIC